MRNRIGVELSLSLSLRLIGHTDTISVAISAQGLRVEVRGISFSLVSEARHQTSRDAWRVSKAESAALPEAAAAAA